MEKLFLKIVILFLLSSFGANAQYVDYGEDPARLKWNQINTEHYKIIYPIGNENRANLYALILESAYSNVRTTMLSKRQSRVPVILHPYNITSNGMVAWAPKRMELLPSPGFNHHFQIPEFSLSVHESRHVAQMDRLNQGILRPFHFIFGEQIMGISAGIVPQWLLEGDAVAAETALSSSGRGRSASFMMPYRARIATGKNFSLDKWFMGSYKDYTHDFYALGYGMVSYARINHGADVWNNVLNKITYIPIPPFARALKKNTGLTPKKLFKYTFDHLQKEWDLLEPENPDSLQILSPENKRYTSYLYPQETERGIVCLKKSIDNITAIVLIDSLGKEQHIAYVGHINSKLTVKDNFVYWTESVAGLRWEHENYSVIKRLDLINRKIKIISKRSRYFTPAIMHDGNIAAFEHTPNGQNNVVLLNAAGKQIKSYPVFNNLPVQDMVADNNGNIFASLTGLGNGIFKLNTSTTGWEGILSYQRTNIESLRLCDGNLLFESGYNGVNNIYSLDTLRLSVKRLTNSKFGSFAGTMSRSGDRLIISDYSAKGYTLASIETSKLNEERVSFKNTYKFKVAEALSAQETYNVDTITLSRLQYETKPYRKGLNLFNFHSWLPAFFDVDEMARTNDFELNSFKPGVTLLSQNRLNTMTSQISYYYDLDNHKNHGFLSLRYSGWFPVFQIKLDVGGQREYYYPTKNRRDISDETRIKTEVSMYLPFNFTNNHYIHGLQPFISYSYTNDMFSFTSSNTPSIPNNGPVIIPITEQNYQYINGGIYYYKYRSLAKRDIFPKYGWQFWLRYVGQPYIDMGQLTIGKANIYLPGIVKNHGLRLSASYMHQKIKANQYFFPQNFVDVARGNYYYLPTEELYTIKADYSFAIAHPDWNIGSLIYIPRIRSNVFYDFTNSYVGNNGWIKQSSYGVDLILDMYFMRLKYAPSTLMFRFIKPTKDSLLSLNVSLGFNIN